MNTAVSDSTRSNMLLTAWIESREERVKTMSLNRSEQTLAGT
jgi:hypothetical protein